MCRSSHSNRVRVELCHARQQLRRRWTKRLHQQASPAPPRHARTCMRHRWNRSREHGRNDTCPASSPPGPRSMLQPVNTNTAQTPDSLPVELLDTPHQGAYPSFSHVSMCVSRPALWSCTKATSSSRCTKHALLLLWRQSKKLQSHRTRQCQQWLACGM